MAKRERLRFENGFENDFVWFVESACRGSANKFSKIAKLEFFFRFFLESIFRFILCGVFVLDFLCIRILQKLIIKD